jgi:hypothetical protein
VLVPFTTAELPCEATVTPCLQQPDYMADKYVHPENDDGGRSVTPRPAKRRIPFVAQAKLAGTLRRGFKSTSSPLTVIIRTPVSNPRHRFRPTESRPSRSHTVPRCSLFLSIVVTRDSTEALRQNHDSLLRMRLSCSTALWVALPPAQPDCQLCQVQLPCENFHSSPARGAA